MYGLSSRYKDSETQKCYLLSDSVKAETLIMLNPGPDMIHLIMLETGEYKGQVCQVRSGVRWVKYNPTCIKQQL